MNASRIALLTRHWLTLLGLVLVTTMAMPGPAWAESQRYRDEVFTSVDVTSNIPYGQAPDVNGEPVKLLLDLYQPSGDTEASRPVFVWVHGGGFTGGSKAGPPASTICDHLAKLGYVCVSIDYRLRPGQYFAETDPAVAGPVADAQHDAQAAVRWLRANASRYRIDSERIAMGGTSAGAVTALQVGYNSGDPGDSGTPGYPSDVTAVIDVSGAMNVSLIEGGGPPVMIVHGNVDKRVSYQNALDIAAGAEAAGVPVELHTIEGSGHGLWDAGYGDQIIPWMSDFLYRYLTPPPAGGSGTEVNPPSGWPTGRYLLVIAPLAGFVVVLLIGTWFAVQRYSVRRR
jgi:acetyl esterase/lipase